MFLHFALVRIEGSPGMGCSITTRKATYGWGSSTIENTVSRSCLYEKSYTRCGGWLVYGSNIRDKNSGSRMVTR